jgi:MFS transporter, SP family, solute carrier family 2 (myo-inositol transporter), member 13
MGCFLFIIGAVLQAASYSLAQMTVGRLIVGFGVGSAAMIVPLYIAEVAPAKYRGRMIGLDNMSITGGQLISYGIGAGLAKVPHGWRAMVVCIPHFPTPMKLADLFNRDLELFPP